jgi:hypothetical protein
MPAGVDTALICINELTFVVPVLTLQALLLRFGPDVLTSSDLCNDPVKKIIRIEYLISVLAVMQKHW